MAKGAKDMKQSREQGGKEIEFGPYGNWHAPAISHYTSRLSMLC
jgi:hypothetical protein